MSHQTIIESYKSDLENAVEHGDKDEVLNLICIICNNVKMEIKAEASSKTFDLANSINNL